MAWNYSAPVSLQAITINNMATLAQINSCVNCTGIDLIHSAFFVQTISTNATFVDISNTTSLDSSAIELVNRATIGQDNFCTNCIEANHHTALSLFNTPIWPV